MADMGEAMKTVRLTTHMHEHVKITSYVDVESVILDKSHSINVEIEALCHRRCRQCICRG